jgi:hypothetical protein
VQLPNYPLRNVQRAHPLAGRSTAEYQALVSAGRWRVRMPGTERDQG